MKIINNINININITNSLKIKIEASDTVGRGHWCDLITFGGEALYCNAFADGFALIDALPLYYSAI